nr:hypothetical protein DGKKSRWO_DGKKSRWO_CDS_0118 [uncultured phage]CAI9752295.1 hypothetical protein CVNMHQAP_CVNMHQAP_CDS_0118 [uncultured phage]
MSWKHRQRLMYSEHKWMAYKAKCLIYRIVILF